MLFSNSANLEKKYKHFRFLRKNSLFYLISNVLLFITNKKKDDKKNVAIVNNLPETWVVFTFRYGGTSKFFLV